MPPRPPATPSPVPGEPGGTPRPCGLCVFVTDFGTADTYAAQMAGAFHNAFGPNPAGRVAAEYHAVPPQDVAAGAAALAEVVPAFPPGTAFVTVVDPGVGTGRRILAARAGGHFHVAPDNGLLAALLDADPAAAAVRLPVPDAGSATFHGRDVMAPAAGRLAAGVPLGRLGEAVSDWVRLPAAAGWEERDGVIVGTVARADRFGNLVTTVPRPACANPREVRLDGVPVPAGRTYADVPPHTPVALVGSGGMWEIAVRDGSAADALAAAAGDEVHFTPAG